MLCVLFGGMLSLGILAVESLCSITSKLANTLWFSTTAAIVWSMIFFYENNILKLTLVPLLLCIVIGIYTIDAYGEIYREKALKQAKTKTSPKSG